MEVQESPKISIEKLKKLTNYLYEDKIETEKIHEVQLRKIIKKLQAFTIKKSKVFPNFIVLME